MAKIVFNAKNEEGVLGRIDFIVSEKDPSRNASMTFKYVKPSPEIFTDASGRVLKNQCVFPAILEYKDRNGKKTEKIHFMVDRGLKTACFFSEKEEGDLLQSLFKDSVVNISYKMAERMLKKQMELTRADYLNELNEEVKKRIQEIQSFVLVRFTGKAVELKSQDDFFEEPVEFMKFLKTAGGVEEKFEEGKFVILPYRLEGDKDFFMEVVWSLTERKSSMYHYLRLEDIISCYLAQDNVRHLHVIVGTQFEVDPVFFYDKKIEDLREYGIERYYLSREDVKTLALRFNEMMKSEQQEVRKVMEVIKKEAKSFEDVLSKTGADEKRITTSMSI